MVRIANRSGLAHFGGSGGCADGAAVYAPNAACTGQTSNAGTDFYGSMICNTIDNVGGWTFHYDTRLAALGDGTWHIKAYAEP